ncbi:hypothetical protein N9242_04385 [Vicingaceae bacterium]|nr:hypothetical protein [Vicingaceae bacterium]
MKNQKKGANILAPNNSVPITVAPSIKESNSKYFTVIDFIIRVRKYYKRFNSIKRNFIKE